MFGPSPTERPLKNERRMHRLNSNVMGMCCFVVVIVSPELDTLLLNQNIHFVEMPILYFGPVASRVQKAIDKSNRTFLQSGG